MHVNFHVYVCTEMLIIFLYLFLYLKGTSSKEGKKVNNGVTVTTARPIQNFTWNTPWCRLLPESGMVK